MRKWTPRGFRIYAEVNDSYGADVDVIESSAAQIEGEDRGPWVWIYIEKGTLRDNHGAAHLDLREAIKVRDALNAFIVEHSAAPRSEAVDKAIEDLGSLVSSAGGRGYEALSVIKDALGW